MPPKKSTNTNNPSNMEAGEGGQVPPAPQRKPERSRESVLNRKKVPTSQRSFKRKPSKNKITGISQPNPGKDVRGEKDSVLERGKGVGRVEGRIRTARKVCACREMISKISVVFII